MNFWLFFGSLIAAAAALDQFASCDFKVDDDDAYKCELTLNIPNGIAEIDDILGRHLDNFTDSDVTVIETTFVSSSLYLPAIICDRFGNVTKMIIQTGLEKVDKKSLKGCKNLESLNFFFNKIKEIDVNAFADNQLLDFVDLSGNQLKTLPTKLFQPQSYNLRTLRLQDNRNLLLSSDFFKHIPYLTELSLAVYHPGWLNSLEYLYKLHVGPSEVLELPKNLFGELKNLQILILNEKNLTVLHADTFGLLPNLRQLWMKNDGIKAIDKKIFEMTGIDDVNLEGNVCADGRFSGDKGAILKGLKKCFDNYKGRKN